MVLMPIAFWKRSFWVSYWIALRRSRKDKRARTFAFIVTFLIADVLGFIPLVLFMMYREAGGFQALAGYGVVLVTALVAVAVMRRSHKRQDALLSCSLTERTLVRFAVGDEVAQAVRDYLEERALIVGALLARAAREIQIRFLESPVTAEMVTRQALIALLRRNELWEKLEPSEAELMRMAEGEWNVNLRENVVRWCEQLRLLRWVLGIDPDLMPLAHLPQLDFTLGVGLPEGGQPPTAVGSIRMSWEVRVERDTALEYAARAIAELNGRGLILDHRDLDGWADQLRERSLGASTDYLAGPETVGELAEADLVHLSSVAVARQRFSAYLVDQLIAAAPLPFTAWTERA